MFEDVFVKLHDKNKEIKIMGVWGKDGLELEKKYFSEMANLDVDFVGAELADLISKLDTIKLTPEKFFLEINYREYLLMVFSLTTDYFLIMITDKTIILGKLNFYLNLFRNQLVSEL